MGNIKDQLILFEKTSKGLLTTLITQLDVSIEGFRKYSMTDQIREQRFKEIKQMDPWFVNQIVAPLDKIITSTMDQFEGLRQIKDFRSLPNVSHIILLEGARINIFIERALESVVILVLEKELQQQDDKRLFSITLENDEHFQTIKDKFQDFSYNILRQYNNLKTGILRTTQHVSSLRIMVDQFNLNCIIGQEFLQEVIETADKFVNDKQKMYQEKLVAIQAAFPLEIQRGLVENIEKTFGHQLEKNLNSVMPWIMQWSQTQVSAILHREIFAPTKEQLIEILNQNKNQMIQGFKELMESGLSEPFTSIKKNFALIDNEIDLVKYVTKE